MSALTVVLIYGGTFICLAAFCLAASWLAIDWAIGQFQDTDQ